MLAPRASVQGTWWDADRTPSPASSTLLGASLVAQTVNRLPTMRETWVRALGWEDPLEKEMATHSSILAWKIPWTEVPGRLQFMGLQRVAHDWATSLSLSTLLCLENSFSCMTLLTCQVPGETVLSPWEVESLVSNRTLWISLWQLYFIYPCITSMCGTFLGAQYVLSKNFAKWLKICFYCFLFVLK